MTDAAAVEALCRDWPAELVRRGDSVWLEVDGYFPEQEIRSAEVSAVVSHVAQVPFVREWMKELQRSCVRFGNLVMEGRDITSNIFPDTPHKFYLDASAEVRQARRDADGVEENLATRDQRDSTRKAAPLKVVEGATVINNSGESPKKPVPGSLRWQAARPITSASERTPLFHPRFESADKVANNGGAFVDQTGVDLQQTGAGSEFSQASLA